MRLGNISRLWCTKIWSIGDALLSSQPSNLSFLASYLLLWFSSVSKLFWSSTPRKTLNQPSYLLIHKNWQTPHTSTIHWHTTLKTTITRKANEKSMILCLEQLWADFNLIREVAPKFSIPALSLASAHAMSSLKRSSFNWWHGVSLLTNNSFRVLVEVWIRVLPFNVRVVLWERGRYIGILRSSWVRGRWWPSQAVCCHIVY